MVTILATHKPLLPHSSRLPQALAHVLAELDPPVAEPPPTAAPPPCELPPADEDEPPVEALLELLLLPQAKTSVLLTTKNNPIAGFMFNLLRSLVMRVLNPAPGVGSIP
jgi:hypothetical protein